MILKQTQSKKESVSRKATWLLAFFILSFTLGVFGVGDYKSSFAQSVLDIRSLQFETKLTQVNEGKFSVEATLLAQADLRVGDSVVLGPRSQGVVKTLALGWVNESKIDEQCEGIKPDLVLGGKQSPEVDEVSSEAKPSSQVLPFKCPGAELVAFTDLDWRVGETLVQSFAVSDLGGEVTPPGDTVGVSVEMENGEKWVWLSVKALDSGNLQGAVLDSFSNNACKSLVGLLCSDSILDDIGEGALTAVNSILSAVIGAFNEFINFIASYFVIPSLQAVLSIRTYTDEFAAPIFPAWKVLRNLANIIFILAIVAMGLATIFRVGGWRSQDMLVRLIIAAILINFSLVFAQTILGVADALQEQFMPSDSGAIYQLGDTLFIKGKGLVSNFPEDIGWGQFETTVKFLFGFVVTFMSFVAFVCLWFFVVFRIMFLWLLLLTSPLAYAAMVLPLTRSMTSRWWRNFIGYAFMTPAVAFMINLTALIARDQTKLLENMSNGNLNISNGAVKTVMYAVANQAIVIAFLFLSIKAASFLKTESGGLVDSVAKKGWDRAVSGSKSGLKLARDVGTLGAYRPAKNYAKVQGKYWMDRGKGFYYEKIAEKFGPKVDPSTNKPIKGNALKRLAFNFLSGGKADEALLEEGKYFLSKGQGIAKAVGEDYRNAHWNKPLTAQEEFRIREENKKIKEHSDLIERQSLGVVAKAAVERIQRGELNTASEYPKFMAELQQILKQGGLDGVIKDLGAKDIEGLYGALAKNGLSADQLNAVRSSVNYQARDKGRLDLMVDAKAELKPEDLSKAYDEFKAGRVSSVGEAYKVGTSGEQFDSINQRSRQDVWTGKAPTDLPSMHNNVLFVLDPVKKYDDVQVVKKPAEYVSQPRDAHGAPIDHFKGQKQLLGASDVMIHLLSTQFKDRSVDFKGNPIPGQFAMTAASNMPSRVKLYLKELKRDATLWSATQTQLSAIGLSASEIKNVESNIDALT